MRLQILIPSLHGAGAERFVSSLSVALAARGVTIDWVMLHDEVVFEFAGTKTVIGDSGKSVPDTTSKWAMLARALRVARRMRKENRRFRPDLTLVVPVSGELHYATTLLMLFRSCGLFRGKVVVYEGTVQSAAFTGTTWRGRIVRRLRFFALKLVDRVVAISEAVRRDLIENFAAPPERTVMIPHGFDVEGIRRLAKEVPPAEWPNDGLPVVLSVGRLIPLKRHEWQIAAFEMVRERIPARLVIVGEGPLLECIQKRIAASPAREFIHLLGWQTNPYAVMSRATAFMLTSDQEAFGNVLVEAMACGTPAVCFDCPGAPAEVLAHGRGGIVLPLGDIAALAETLVTLFATPEERETWSQKALQRANEFSLPTVAENYLQLFADL